jgi:hypothetical protein
VKITKTQLRRLIKEAIGDGFEEMKAGLGPGPAATGISSTPTGKVEVEWDFFLDGDEEGWNELPYEEQEASEGLPPVIEIPSDVMNQYIGMVSQYGESQAEQMITDWLSDESGWLHQGWSWV